MKKYTLLLFVLFFIASGAYAQNSSGKITFQRKKEWVKLNDKLPWISEEEKERSQRTWGNSKRPPVPYELYFNGEWCENHSLGTCCCADAVA